MSNINEARKTFLVANGIKVGTIAWRAYITSLGYYAGSIVQDTKNMLVATGNWTGNINESLFKYFENSFPLGPLTPTTLLSPTTEMSRFSY